MKLSSFALKTSALLLVSAVLYGTTYATSLVTPQTNICVKISNDYSAKALSLSIKPYYNNKVITDIGIYSDNGTCIKVDRDWLLGGAKPGTSFVVTGKDRNNRTYLLENRDIAMFRNTKDIKEKAWLSIKYDINSAVNSSGTLLIGSVTSEFHIYEAGAVETVTPPKGIYRSDLTAMDSLNAMRQIGATKYTNITDFK